MRSISVSSRSQIVLYLSDWGSLLSHCHRAVIICCLYFLFHGWSILSGGAVNSLHLQVWWLLSGEVKGLSMPSTRQAITSAGHRQGQVSKQGTKLREQEFPQAKECFSPAEQVGSCTEAFPGEDVFCCGWHATSPGMEEVKGWWVVLLPCSRGWKESRNNSHGQYIG